MKIAPIDQVGHQDPSAEGVCRNVLPDVGNRGHRLARLPVVDARAHVTVDLRDHIHRLLELFIPNEHVDKRTTVRAVTPRGVSRCPGSVQRWQLAVPAKDPANPAAENRPDSDRLGQFGIPSGIDHQNALRRAVPQSGN